MLEINIPGFGKLELEHLVCDFTGTLSVNGYLLPTVKERLEELSTLLTIHVVSADTFGRVNNELSESSCAITVLKGKQLDVQKEQYVNNLNANRVVAIGNGANDRLMLRSARLGIAIVEGEGCAVGAMQNADILVRSIQEGLSLLLNTQRIVATLKV